MSIDFLDMLKNIGALKEGHFLLASGRHSNQYIEKFDVLRQPVAASAALQPLVQQFRSAAIDVVVGPTTGGVILAFEVARQLGVAAAYAERRANDRPGREFRRGTRFGRSQRVLVIDDILTTGGSIADTLVALEDEPVTVVAIAVLVDRSGGKVAFGETPLIALATLEIETWDAAGCPLCKGNVQLVRPGTTNPA